MHTLNITEHAHITSSVIHASDTNNLLIQTAHLIYLFHNHTQSLQQWSLCAMVMSMILFHLKAATIIILTFI